MLHELRTSEQASARSSERQDDIYKSDTKLNHGERCVRVSHKANLSQPLARCEHKTMKTQWREREGEKDFAHLQSFEERLDEFMSPSNPFYLAIYAAIGATRSMSQ